MLTTVIAVTLVLQQQTVNFTHPCDRAEVVLEALGNELGTPIKPSGSVHQDFFLVRFKEVPIQEALDKIATTLNATWSTKDGVQYLGRSRAQEVADFEAEYKWQSDAIKKAIAALETGELTADEAARIAVEVREYEDDGSNDALFEFQPVANQLPANRAMLRIAKILDFDSIVRSTGSPVRFSTEEGKTPFPKASDAIFKQLFREWAVFSEQSAKAGLSSDNRFAGMYQTDKAGPEMFEQAMQLSVTIGDFGVTMQLSYVNGSRWQNIAYFRLPFEDLARVPAWIEGLKGKAALDQVAMSSVTTLTYGEKSDRLRDALLDPERSDVALSAPGGVILQAAEQTGTSVVALVPDAAYRAFAKAKLPAEPRLSTLASALITERAMVFEMEDGWLTGRPRNPYSARSERMDRGAFRKMLRYAVDRESLPIDPFADFVAKSESDEPVTIADALMGRALEMRFGLPNYGIEKFRIYGRLSQLERTATRSEAIQLSGRQDARRFVRSIGSYVSQGMHMRGTMPGVKRPFNEEAEARSLIPQGTTWNISVSDSGFVQPNAFDKSVGGWTNYSDLHSFAMNMVSAEKRPSQSVDYSAMAPVYGATIYLGHEENGGGGTSFGRYADPIAKSKFGSINDLPDEIKTELLKEIEYWKKRRSGGTR